jgi:hypothetical protein
MPNGDAPTGVGEQATGGDGGQVLTDDRGIAAKTTAVLDQLAVQSTVQFLADRVGA